MIVLVLTACPAGLRGFLTRWLLEISAGVFVGNVSARIREDIWEMTIQLAKDGRSIMIHSANNEQGMDFKVHRHSWVPSDFDGLTLMSRPLTRGDKPAPSRKPRAAVEGADFMAEEPPPSQVRPEGALRPGWSNASRRRYLKKTHDS